MCVIVYKPVGKLLPNVKRLEKCFNSNRDGAGYMLPINNKVVIHKGFMKFNDFIKDLENTFRDNNLDPLTTPVVMHFRIGTQGGNTAELCHPYPICRDYEEMRKTTNECDLALAHNGIISRCSEHVYGGGRWDSHLKTWVQSERTIPNYNDTMTFIKDYASLIIDNDQYFARNKSKCELLEKLCENGKLAIMNKKGFVKLIGQFYEVDGIYYSNTYSLYEPKSFKSTKDVISSIDEDGTTHDIRLVDMGDQW